MDTLAGFPYMTAAFDRRAMPLDADIHDKVCAWLATQAATDLLVLAHGWNNDTDEAAALYAKLAASLREVPGGRLQDRRLALLGIFWPSKKFADSELIPGGAASADSDIDAGVLTAQIDALRVLVEDDREPELEALRDIVPRLEGDPAARIAFFRHARALFGAPDALTPDDGEEIPDEFFDATSDDDIAVLFDGLRKPDPPHLSTATTRSGAAGFSFNGVKAGAQRLLNYVTYYRMKARAREVGGKAVSPLLHRIRAARPDLRIHLAGHSFGGLVVTSAALGDAGAPSVPVRSLTLLQAAFSHNGFADQLGPGRSGDYRGVLSAARVDGPILITHTHNDKAVGVAYALASRFSGTTAAGIGDADDPFGGIGANGAQKTSERVEMDLEDAGFAYRFERGKVYNLRADSFISGHSDVTGAQVAHALAAAIAGP